MTEHPRLHSKVLCQEGLPSAEMPCHLASEHLCGWDPGLFFSLRQASHVPQLLSAMSDLHQGCSAVKSD